MTTRLHRFFVSPDSIHNDRATLGGSLVHQLRNVLHLRAGERVVLLDNSGWEFEVELESVNAAEVSGRVVDKRPSLHEPRVTLVLFQALLKADKFEWVLQKGTELGIAAFMPLVSERVVRDEVSAKKMKRWQRIVREAAEQSERAIVPQIKAPIAFADAVQSAMRDGLSLILYEAERGESLRAHLQNHRDAQRINLFIGPEGGFSADEIASAKQQRVTPVTLGPRILRAETAGLVAASAILYELGEMG